MGHAEGTKGISEAAGAAVGDAAGPSVGGAWVTAGSEPQAPPASAAARSTTRVRRDDGIGPAYQHGAGGGR